MRWMWLMTLLAITLAHLAHARQDTVFRCVGDAGESYFTDRACPEGQVLSFDPARVVTLSLLDEEARNQARRLDHDLDARMRARTSMRSGPSPERARAKAQRCSAAQEGLDRIRAQKRHGYRVASAGALDAREVQYEQQRARECSDGAP